MAIFSSCGSEMIPTEEPVNVEISSDMQLMFLDREKPITAEEEKISITVSSDGKDVTSDAVVYYAYGNSVDIEKASRLKDRHFVGDVAGIWTLVAVYKGSQSEPLQIQVIDPREYNSVYQRHIAAFEFTGAWCSWCPKGLTVMNNVIDYDESYKDLVHMMAFHSDSGGQDALAIDQTDVIYDRFRLGEYPSFVTDMRDSGGLSDGYDFLESIQNSFNLFPAHCGVAVSSSCNGGKADIKVKITSELALPYRIAVFLVEDGVQYYQKGVANSETYVHFHVVRKVVSSSWSGDKVGTAELTPGQEYIKEYNGVSLDSSWNLSNVSVYVLAMDYASRVNNMNICAVDGGESAYMMIN